MPDETLTTFTLPPTGERVMTPPLDGDRYRYEVEVDGTFRCSYDNREYDALYRTDANGRFTERHDLLDAGRSQAQMLSEDFAAHRYRFQLPVLPEGEGLRIDIDRLVDRYLIPPSEVRSSLSGGLNVRVIQIPLFPPNPWLTAAYVGLPVTAAAAGIGMIVRRRMMLWGLSDDLAACLVRIQKKSKAARAILAKDGLGSAGAAAKLAAVNEGAVLLVRKIQGLRESRSSADRKTLEVEVQMLRDRAFKCAETGMRAEAESALEEKAKLLTLLDELEAAETRSTLRLTKIEAVLDSARMSMSAAKAASRDHRPEEALQRELDAQVNAIREVSREMEEAQVLSAGLMGR